ncbi:MAG: hypothetical protein IJV94_04805 [Bacilli bacterium]|nr:hypothetical protein [Bacilli bacterium]
MGLKETKITFKNEVGTFFIILIGTFVFSYLIFIAFDKTKTLPNYIDMYYGFGFGCAAGFIFMLSFAVAGGMENSFFVELERWIEFFKDLRISFKFATRNFFDHIKEEGFAFWLYILLMVAQVGVAYYCFSNLIEIYL